MALKSSSDSNLHDVRMDRSKHRYPNPAWALKTRLQKGGFPMTQKMPKVLRTNTVKNQSKAMKTYEKSKFLTCHDTIA